MSNKKQLKINVTPDKIEARFSDIVIVSKNALGMTFDFGQRMPGSNQVNVVSRVAMSPQHAKLFLGLLQKNIEDFEKQFGDIEVKKPPGVGKDGKFIHFVK